MSTAHGGLRARAGRPRGAPNKDKLAIRERLDRLGCDPIGYLAMTVNNQVKCGVCRGNGTTEFQPLNGQEPGKRKCQSCWGSGLERLTPKERSWAAGELLQYCEAKLKQVDHTSSDGSNRPIWVVNVAQEVPVVPPARVIDAIASSSDDEDSLMQ